ncbi:MAG: class I SAM-dependent methyltransferase [Acidimicrobiales bacterium]
MESAHFNDDDAESMRRSWEARADSNPLYAIDAHRREWDIDEFYARGPELVEEIVDPALRILNVNPRGLRVLEIGCGMGRLFVGLAERFEEVWGLDISASMIEQGRNNCHANATWLIGDGTSLTGVDDESVDHVLSYEVFEHIPRQSIIRSYLDESWRVLRPGGTLLAQLRNTSDSKRQAALRAMPRSLRIASGAVLRRLGVMPVQGDIDTWLGCEVPPQDGISMMEAQKFVDVRAFDSTFVGFPQEDQIRYWIVARKPG